ncbi:hypothetical protein DPMN_167136 [Dreissena polymorpha]|uniref:Uncharacterized protein n=1 Tax=Dreissena polymorpha TaxID=45954 RepID=A0A9D4F3C2_DREPO|nr:hypothetical protein DPMN_167136 [Dreissena polymorpha]
MYTAYVDFRRRSAELHRDACSRGGRTVNLQDLTAYLQKRLRLTRSPAWNYYTRSSARYEKKKKFQQSGEGYLLKLPKKGDHRVSLKLFCRYAVRSCRFAVLQLLDGAADLFLCESAALDWQITKSWRNLRWVRRSAC